MPDLTDFLETYYLEHLRKGFADLAGRAVCIWSADRKTLLIPGCDDQLISGEGACCRNMEKLPAVAVLVDGEKVGYLTLGPSHDDAEDGQPSPWARRMLCLMANVVGGMCERESQLRSRMDELGTLYNLTAEFAGGRSLQEVLDVVARTVVKVLGAKACSIRLLSPDKEELVIKAVVNLSDEYLKKGAILLSESLIDREALAANKPVYIADERSDPRVLYPAEARREGIVSALCAPMVYHGEPEGIIRVYTDRPYEFDWFEASLMQAIAAQAAAAVVNARLNQEAIELATMRRHLAMAAEVQRRMIPKEPPKPKGFDLGAVYIPCYELGGDFYDFIDLPEDNFGVAVCDVVGKGVRASLLMSSVRASLRGHAVNVYEMSLVLDKVNRDLCADSLVSDFATMCYGVLDVDDRRFTYANAGHAPPMLVRDGKLMQMEGGGCLLGVDPSAHYEHQLLMFQPGDVVLMYTDGLTDAMNFEEECFGRQRIEESLLEAVGQGFTAEQIVKHVVWNMRKFAGLTPRFDDTTLVAIRAL